jgi:hypothetical protein
VPDWRRLPLIEVLVVIAIILMRCVVAIRVSVRP